MVNALYSYSSDKLAKTNKVKTITIPDSGELIGFDPEFREMIQNPNDGGLDRIYDFFVATISGATTLIVGINELVFDDIDSEAPILEFPAAFELSRTFPHGLDAVVTKSSEGKVSYDIFVTSRGNPTGFGTVDIQIRRIKQELGPEEINNILTEIVNVSGFVGMTIVRRLTVDKTIIYDIITAYLPAP